MADFNDLVAGLTLEAINGIPAVSVLVKDRTGETHLTKTSGFHSLDPDSPPLNDQSIFRLSSSSQIFTAVAALQCVERGQITLDAPVYDVLPELKGKQIISSNLGPATSVSLGHPSDSLADFSFTDAKESITLRRLLSHTSGIGYDILDPTLQGWRMSRKEAPRSTNGTATGMFDAPLLFEPGSDWTYGAGYDAVGLLVSRLNDNMGLEAYLQKYICEPLSLKNTTFFVRRLDKGLERLVECVTEAPDGNLVPFPDTTADDPREEQGSGGLYSSVEDVSAVLVDLLADEPKILKRKTTDECLLSPAIDPGSKAMKGFAAAEFLWGTFSGGVSVDDESGVKVNYSLGGLLIQQPDHKNGGMKTTLQWAGGTGTLWRLEKEKGIAAFYATQIFPPMDSRAKVLREAFLEEVKEIARS